MKWLVIESRKCHRWHLFEYDMLLVIGIGVLFWMRNVFCIYFLCGRQRNILTYCSIEFQLIPFKGNRVILPSKATYEASSHSKSIYVLEHISNKQIFTFWCCSGFYFWNHKSPQRLHSTLNLTYIFSIQNCVFIIALPFIEYFWTKYLFLDNLWW